MLIGARWRSRCKDAGSPRTDDVRGRLRTPQIGLQRVPVSAGAPRAEHECAHPGGEDGRGDEDHPLVGLVRRVRDPREDRGQKKEERAESAPLRGSRHGRNLAVKGADGGGTLAAQLDAGLL